MRIGANTLVRDHYYYPSGELTTTGVDDVAFQNPDGSRVLVAYAYTRAPASFSVSDGGDTFRYRLAPGRDRDLHLDPEPARAERRDRYVRAKRVTASRASAP